MLQQKSLRFAAAVSIRATTCAAAAAACAQPAAAAASASYHALPTPPADPLPWKSLTTKQENLHGVSFNPLGKALRPPMPVMLLPGLTQTHQAYSNLVRHLNYPYGVISMDMRGRGKSQSASVSAEVRAKAEQMRCGPEIFQHVSDVISVLNAFHCYKAFMVGNEFGAVVAYWVAQLFPDRCNGLVLIDGVFPQGQLPKHVSESLGREVDVLKRLSAGTSPQEYYQQLTQSKKLPFEKLSKSEQERLQYEVENRPAQFDQIERDLALLQSGNVLHTSDKMLHVRHPMLVVRAEAGATEGSAPFVDNEANKDVERKLNVKDQYLAKGATHYSLLQDDAHAKKVAEKIDVMLSKFDVHRRVEKQFEELRDFEE